MPPIATQKPIVQPPYNYSRNPVAIEVIVMYPGVDMLYRSIGAMTLVLLSAGLLPNYIRRIEEKELEICFGEQYPECKRQMPFLMPRFWNRP